MIEYGGSILFGLFLVAILAADVGVLVSLGRQGDERRRLIVYKASFNSFGIVVIYVMVSALENVVNVLVRDLPGENLNPFILLTVMAVIYAGELYYCKKRYGD